MGVCQVAELEIVHFTDSSVLQAHLVRLFKEGIEVNDRALIALQLLLGDVFTDEEQVKFSEQLHEITVRIVKYERHAHQVAELLDAGLPHEYL